jgi:sialic acid synthase SpsE
MIIVDMGSGNTCQNNTNKAREMVMELAYLRVPGAVVKWQLFKKAGDNVPLSEEVFEQAFHYASLVGLGTTASVFDKESLDFLLKFRVPFVKLANTKASRDLLPIVPEDMRVIISTDDPDFKTDRKNTDIIYCVSKYPAADEDYKKFGDKLKKGMSDHTTGWNLFNTHQPKIYECHFKLKDSTGLDAGAFARTPEQFTKILHREFSVEEAMKFA